MTFLYVCDTCKREEHEKCERSTPAKHGEFGGRKCACPCNGRSKKQMQKDWEEHFKRILKQGY